MITTTKNKISYVSDGATTNYDFDFPAIEPDDIQVFVYDLNSNKTQLVYGTDYSVSLNSDDSGGTVTLTNPVNKDYTILIYREVPYTQETVYTENSPFPAKSHEKALDKLTLLSQQLQEKFDRTLQYDPADEGQGVTLPPMVGGGFLGTTPDKKLTWRANVNYSNINLKVNTISDLLNVNLTNWDGIQPFVVLVLGYHDAGDGGGGVFYWDANEDKANHNGGTIIDPTKTFPTDWSDTSQQDTWFNTTNTSSGCWKRVYNDEVNVEWFGAKGDGITDDSYALQQLTNFANVRFDNKTHFVSRSFIFNKFDNYNIVSDNAHFVVDENSTNYTQVSCNDNHKVVFWFGYYDDDLFSADTTLSATATTGDTEITVADASIFLKGDYICIWDNNTGSYSQYRDYYYNGEFKRILDVDTTNNILKLDGVIESLDTYPTGIPVYKVNFAKMNFQGHIKITVPPSSNLEIMDSIVFNGFVNSNIDTVTIDDCNYSGFVVRKSYNVTVNNLFVKATYHNSIGNAYPSAVDNSNNVNIKSLIGTSWWHVFTNGGNDTTCSIVNRNITINYINAQAEDNRAIDPIVTLHGNIDGFTINSGKIVGGFCGSGNNIKVNADIIQYNSFVAIYHSEVAGYNFDYSGCKIYHYGDIDSTYSNHSIFDFGNNNISDQYVKHDGVIILPNFIKSVGASTSFIVVYKRYSGTDVNLSITVPNNLQLISTDGEQIVFNIRATNSIQKLTVNGIYHTKPLYVSITNIDNKSGIIESQSGSITLANGDAYATQNVVFNSYSNINVVATVVTAALYNGSGLLVGGTTSVSQDTTNKNTTVSVYLATADASKVSQDYNGTYNVLLTL